MRQCHTHTRSHVFFSRECIFSCSEVDDRGADERSADERRGVVVSIGPWYWNLSIYLACRVSPLDLRVDRQRQGFGSKAGVTQVLDSRYLQYAQLAVGAK